MPKKTTTSSITIVGCLQTVSTALDDIADANAKLISHQQRLQALFAQLLRVAQDSAPQNYRTAASSRRSDASRGKPGAIRTASELLKVQMSMQRENQIFTSISNVLKTRHDTAKNAIGNIR